ncbi:EamA family transporter [Metallibacterium sp.]|uniref:EamA family transporter n=1 Tax=Metallibacterium sp. TaxID=2940281 RepID=UPI0026021960|nr:EamA family transporter [Metallibacterium sp.]
MTLASFITRLTVMVFDTGGQLTFKAAANHGGGEGMAHWRAMARKPWLGLLSFVVEFVAWLAFLSLVPLAEGVLLATLNMVTIMLGGRFLFGEKLTPRRLLGVGLIAAGVILVGVG